MDTCIQAAICSACGGTLFRLNTSEVSRSISHRSTLDGQQCQLVPSIQDSQLTLTGYEGPFGIVRAGDVSYPAHLPVAMTTVPAQPPPTHGVPGPVQAQSAVAPTQTGAYNTDQAHNVSQNTADPARADFGDQPAPATATTVDDDAPTTTGIGGVNDLGDTITNASVSAQAAASVLSPSAGSSGSPMNGSFAVPPALPMGGNEEMGGSSGR